MDPIVITFDIDWAPDESIREIAEKLIKANQKSTWFVTHETKELEFFRSHPDLFELGIHPNFLKGTTHGNSEEEIIETLMHLVPEAQVMRTHSVYQSGHLLNKLVNQTPIRIDSSIFLPEMSHIVKVKHLTGAGPLDRFPIFWADDYELLKESSKWNPLPYFDQVGMKVFLFHPIHIYLNTGKMEDYDKYKQSGILDKYSELGVANFFDRLITYLTDRKIKTKFLRDI